MPYFWDKASQPVPELNVWPCFAPHVVVAGGLVVVVLLGVGAGAKSRVMGARVVIAGIEVLQTSTTSCN
jgi:hypothetical protein